MNAATTDAPVVDPSLVPGAMETVRRRETPEGVIEFEQAPVGWIGSGGEPRTKDWRAYYWTPTERECEPCTGSGRVAGKTAKGRKCTDCNGTGNAAKRTRLPSVTTILDAILPKPGLPPWAEKHGILGAVEAIRRGELDPRDQNIDPVARVRGLKLGADNARDRAATRGLNVHALLEAYMLTGEPPNLGDHPTEHWGYLQALTRWLMKANPEPVSVEELVVHPEHGYAGRLDLRANIGGLLHTVDAKTQENGGIYESAHVQARLYERAAVRCGDEPAFQTMVVVFAANGEYREMPCAVTDDAADRALEFWRAMKPTVSVCASANRAERESRKTAA